MGFENVSTHNFANKNQYFPAQCYFKLTVDTVGSHGNSHKMSSPTSADGGSFCTINDTNHNLRRIHSYEWKNWEEGNNRGWLKSHFVLIHEYRLNSNHFIHPSWDIQGTNEAKGEARPLREVS